MLYKKNGAVSFVGNDFHLIWPLYIWIPSWTGFDCGQISIETATHSFNPNVTFRGRSTSPLPRCSHPFNFTLVLVMMRCISQLLRHPTVITGGWWPSQWPVDCNVVPRVCSLEQRATKQQEYSRADLNWPCQSTRLRLRSPNDKLLYQ